MKSTFVLSALACLAGAAPASAAYVYAPGAQYEFQEGGQQGIIFSRGATTHMQLGFKASLFGSTPLLVSAISFRFDSLTYQYHIPLISYDFGVTTIKAATIGDINAMTGVYANNLGANPQTLLDRSYQLVADNTGPVNGPRSWGFVFSFDTPFYYNPAAGDLVLDLATSNGTDAFAMLDMERGGSDMRYVFAYGGTSTVGAGNVSFAGGPISRLTVAPIPEPATWAAMLTGFALAGAAMRRRNSGAIARLV